MAAGAAVTLSTLLGAKTMSERAGVEVRCDADTRHAALLVQMGVQSMLPRSMQQSGHTKKFLLKFGWKIVCGLLILVLILIRVMLL